MGLGWGEGTWLGSCLLPGRGVGRATADWQGDKAILGPAPGLVAGWSLEDRGALPAMSRGVADIPVLAGWPATLMAR